MPLNSSLNSILASGITGKAFRILTTELVRPDGDPPYQPDVSGHIPYITVPAIPNTPPLYTASTFDPAVWTDCTALCSDYHYTQDLLMPIDQLSLSVAMGWTVKALAHVFREMRVIVVQEILASGSQHTEWTNLCWCISDGYTEKWERGVHGYTVEAKNALKLANTERLGAMTGQVVFEADTIAYGSPSSPVAMTCVSSSGDAYEFAVLASNGSIYGDWADKPAAQFWAINVPHAPGNLPVPLKVAGDAVNAVYGEGVLRIGKSYCANAPGDDPVNNPDFTQGLGLATNTPPSISCSLSRFSLPNNFTDRNGNPLPADIKDGLTVTSATGNVLTLSASVIPYGLTLILRDGTGRRFETARGTLTATTSITMSDASATVAVGTSVTFGDANRVTDVLTKVLLDCGFQTQNASAPCYLAPIPNPTLPLELGTSDIILPPVVIKDGDNITALGLIEKFRQEGMIPPNYLIFADNQGKVSMRTVSQIPAGDSGLIPITAMPSSPGLENERTDLNISTRVVVKGMARLATDLALSSSISYATTGNSDNPIASTFYNQVTEPFLPIILGNNLTYPQVDLTQLKTRGQIYQDIRQTRPWRGWAQTNGNWMMDSNYRALKNAFERHDLFVMDFGAAVQIDSIQLQSANFWLAHPLNYYAPYTTDAMLSARHIENDFSPMVYGIYYWTGYNWRLLASGITLPSDNKTGDVTTSSNDFTTRGPVTTQKLCFRCEEAFGAKWFNGSHDTAMVGMWLSQVKVWSVGDIRGVAELGNAANYRATGETPEQSFFDSTGSLFWTNTRKRLGRRTYTVPESGDAVVWVQDQNTANWLAREWLRQRVTDLSPRRFGAIRPDVRVGDTVQFPTPAGDTGQYLIQTADFNKSVIASFNGIDETNPYFDQD